MGGRGPGQQPPEPPGPLGHFLKATSDTSKEEWKETPGPPPSEWLWIQGAGSCWPGQFSPDSVWALPLSGCSADHGDCVDHRPPSSVLSAPLCQHSLAGPVST